MVEKFEGLRGEVRSFMQGQQSADHRPAPRLTPRARKVFEFVVGAVGLEPATR